MGCVPRLQILAMTMALHIVNIFSPMTIVCFHFFLVLGGGFCVNYEPKGQDYECDFGFFGENFRPDFG